jgi:hypothetical protein
MSVQPKQPLSAAARENILVGNMWECRPRILWQAIFDQYIVDGGNLKCMDNLLIDYDNCKKVFDACEVNETFLIGMCLKSGNTTWIEEKSFWPNLQDQIDFLWCDTVLLINVTNDLIRVEKRTKSW